jgi:hypothetical protein
MIVCQGEFLPSLPSIPSHHSEYSVLPVTDGDDGMDIWDNEHKDGDSENNEVMQRLSTTATMTMGMKES